jgi:hypothetical protein
MSFSDGIIAYALREKWAKFKHCLYEIGFPRPRPIAWSEDPGFWVRTYRDRVVASVSSVAMIDNESQEMAKMVYVAQVGGFRMTCATAEEARSVCDDELKRLDYDVRAV